MSGKIRKKLKSKLLRHSTTATDDFGNRIVVIEMNNLVERVLQDKQILKLIKEANGEM